MKVRDAADRFGLSDIMMTSYSRQFDAKTQLTATDMAYSVSALLETQMTESSNGKDSENVNPNMSAADEQTQKEGGLEAINNRLHDNFWVAYDALDLGQNNIHLLKRGIALAKEMQQSIVRVGNGLLDKREIKFTQYFRYCLIENSFLKETQLFQYPLALIKLAHFVMECRKARV